MTRSLFDNAPNNAGRWAAALFIIQFVLIWITFFILSAAIDWPASLDDPAAVALPRLLAHRTDVLTGYSLYLLSALLLVPAVAALCARVSARQGLDRVMMGFAGLSAVAKTIGISRWLFAMPELAKAYATPDANRGAIVIVFQALNDYAGGIGEVVGVGLVAGLLTIMLGWTILQQRGRAARLVGSFSIVAGLLLFANVLGGFGIEIGGILTLSNVVWQFALLGIGLWSLTTPRRTAG